MNLARYPRVRLGHMPTPLEPMDNLSKHLGGPRIWVKRDDCTGLSSGGNKTRKLEFLMAEAQAMRRVARVAPVGERMLRACAPISSQRRSV